MLGYSMMSRSPGNSSRRYTSLYCIILGLAGKVKEKFKGPETYVKDVCGQPKDDGKEKGGAESCQKKESSNLFGETKTALNC